MKSKEILVILVLFLIVGGGSYYFGYWKPLGERDSNTLCIGDFPNKNCFDVEIVDTPESRQIGLMNRENLGDDEGMLFIFDSEGVYPFWMKNTLIPLDIIWINSEKEIVFIHENAEPLSLASINPGKNALYVLEINGGFARELGIGVGMKVEF
jgi:uncharacterized protein